MNVYQRGSVWYYDFLTHGKRVRKATKATSRREAEVEGATALAARAIGPNGATPMTLKPAIMRCYKERWEPGCKDGLRILNRTLKIVDILGDIPLEQVDELALNQLTTQLQQKGLSPASINRYRAYLRKVLNMAHQEWLVIPRVPKIKNTRELLTRFKVYTPEEEEKILTLCDRPMFHLISILVDTGLRLGEALLLTRRNVDFDRGLIVLDPGTTKSGKARAVPMTDRVRFLLADLIEGLPQGTPFFPMTGDQVEKEWRKIRTALGGDKEWVLHAFRHTYASRLVQRGVDLYTVMQLMGHSTFKVTERYAHLNPQKLLEAVKVLN